MPVNSDPDHQLPKRFNKFETGILSNLMESWVPPKVTICSKRSLGGGSKHPI